MKKLIIASIASVVLLTGCAKTMPNPNIQSVSPSDSTASCMLLQNDLQQATTTLATAQHDSNVQTGANVANAVVGFFDIINWFFIDTGNGHDVDAQNAQARINHLNVLIAEKQCR